jgi:hypothetical protein
MTLKKILLIPSINLGTHKIFYDIPLGLLSLKAVSKKYGEAVDILPFSGGILEKKFYDPDGLTDELLGQVDLEDYDTVGLSTLCNSFYLTLMMARAIKEKDPAIDVWMGGAHASVMAGKILDAFPYVDAVFVGESELAFADVLKKRAHGERDLEGIRGIFTRKYGYTPGAIIQDLDDLPWVEVDENFFLEIQKYKDSPIKEAPKLPIEAARGCPGKCKFCSTRLYWGPKVRRKSNGRLISEMRYVRERTGLSSFSLIGDNFGSPRNELLHFCDAVSHKAPDLKWSCSMKLDHITTADLKKLKNAGCQGFFVGVESASQNTLDRLRKGVDIEKEVNVIREAVNMGFDISVSVIIGFPWENREDIDETYKLLCDLDRLGVKRALLNILWPLSGTDLVKEYPVTFDETCIRSLDGIPIDDAAKQFMLRYPEFFLHFGHFEAPSVERRYLEAIEASIFQMNCIKNMLDFKLNTSPPERSSTYSGQDTRGG